MCWCGDTSTPCSGSSRSRCPATPKTWPRRPSSRAWRDADDFRQDASFRAYLFGIARKKLLLHFRSHYRAGKVFSPAEITLDGLAGAAQSPTQRMAEHEQQRLLLAALRRIPIDAQIAIELYYWEELSISDVAAVLDVPAGTIKSRLGRARDRLRTQIEQLAASESLRRSTIDNLDRWAASLRERNKA